MMEKILEVSNLSGGYIAERPFLKNISFSVRKGEMLGLIGLNGAGKSTTIKHILGLLLPATGTIRIHGVTLADNPQQYRAAYAYVPETPALYNELTVKEHLKLTAMAYGVPEHTWAMRTADLAEQFQMEKKLNSFPSHLSKGMKQKVMIMNAFLIAPPLYIIDEPFLGLDPLGIRSMLEMMAALKEQGSSFLLCSHILSTIEKYCDRYVVLDHGQMIASGTQREMAAMTDNPLASLDDLFCELVQKGHRA